jgi:hypothetical protein
VALEAQERVRLRRDPLGDLPVRHD